MAPDTAWHQDGTSVPRSCSLHFWGLLLQFPPLWEHLSLGKDSRMHPQPHSPSWIVEGSRQASSQFQHPNWAAGVHYSLLQSQLPSGEEVAVIAGRGNKYHVPLTGTGKQLARIIIRNAYAPLPICQSAIIGDFVLYIWLAGQKPLSPSGALCPITPLTNWLSRKPYG